MPVRKQQQVNKKGHPKYSVRAVKIKIRTFLSAGQSANLILDDFHGEDYSALRTVAPDRERTPNKSLLSKQRGDALLVFHHAF
jgi:hypothetical protein